MTKAHITSIVSDYINPTGLSVFSSDVRVSGTLSVQNIPVSVSGHNHSSSDITNFNSSVSGLLPVTSILGGSNITINQSGTAFTVAVTGSLGLTTEEVDDRVASLLISGNGINLNYNDNANTLTISSSGLQPSGNYSTVGHTHSSSDITDFNSAASGASPVQSVAGRTGSVTLTKSDVGLSNVDNTSDANKPVSTAQAIADSGVQAYAVQRGNHTGTQLTTTISDFNTSVSGLVNSIYAPLNSPTLTGVPLVPTASSGTNTNQIASTAFVRTEVSNLIASAPSALDTLNELATALGNDANFSTTVTNSLASKANLSGATFTGSVVAPSGDFTTLRQNGTVVSVSGHSHASSDITNFNSSVSGLLPVTNIFAGSGIEVLSSSRNYTVAVNIIDCGELVVSAPSGSDPYWASVDLLLPLDGANNSTAITDISSTPRTFNTNANIFHSTSIKKYGSASLSLPGSALIATTSTTNSTAIGTGDFTLELWAYRTNSQLDRGIIQIGSANDSYDGVAIGVNYNNSTWGIYANNAERTGTISATQNTWMHLAVTRTGGTTRLWVDGVQSLSVADTANYTDRTINIGLWYGSGYSFAGYIDDVRLTVGVARYTASFTPPTQAHPTTGV